MSKQLVFIDDSGDPGFKEGASSSTFVLAAALFIDPEIATFVNKEISDYRQSLGWKDEHEFKFRKAPKKIKLRFLEIVNRYDFDIYAVYINKANYPNVFKFSDDEKLYNWTTKELLGIIPLKEARVKTDGKYGKSYRRRVQAYIRQELNTKDFKRIEDFDIKDSNKDNLIQLADIIVGSIHRSFETDKTDSGEYIRIIRKKIIELKLLDLGGK
ncbi:MAG: DUF3800 domain-containing protein [Candidatus Saccharibacteria bacterium]|nr:DUF3800 domain-containing protein [Candidatus Saccharibacteria bacterium]